jgi:hypothetical protein
LKQVVLSSQVYFLPPPQPGDPTHAVLHHTIDTEDRLNIIRKGNIMKLHLLISQHPLPLLSPSCFLLRRTVRIQEFGRVIKLSHPCQVSACASPILAALSNLFVCFNHSAFTLTKVWQCPNSHPLPGDRLDGSSPLYPPSPLTNETKVNYQPQMKRKRKTNNSAPALLIGVGTSRPLWPPGSPSPLDHTSPSKTARRSAHTCIVFLAGFSLDSFP